MRTEGIERIAPLYPEGRTRRPPFPLEATLCVHFMQQFFCLSDPAMVNEFFDTPLFGEFVQLPDESTTLRFRHRLEKHKLAEQLFKTVNELLTERGLMLNAGTPVAPTLIAAPSSTKNRDRARTPRCNRSRRATSGTTA